MEFLILIHIRVRIPDVNIPFNSLSKWKGNPRRFSCLNFPCDFRGDLRKVSDPLETPEWYYEEPNTARVGGGVLYTVYVSLLKSFDFKEKEKVTRTYLSVSPQSVVDGRRVEAREARETG